MAAAHGVVDAAPAPSATTSAAGVAAGQTCPAPGVRTPEGFCADQQADMVWVAAGEFMMGDTQGTWDADERPARRVFLDGFWIDRTEVSVAHYARCVQAHQCAEQQIGGQQWTGRDFALSPECNWGHDERQCWPINCLAWAEADAYCRWAQKTLPSEAQWEKAARGPDGRPYPWGKARPTCKRAVFGTCNDSRPGPVGSLPHGASPYGALDMAGNVWEWVADWYQDSYAALSHRNPGGPAAGREHICRGGAYYFDVSYLRVANREAHEPAYRHAAVGLRCVRTQ